MRELVELMVIALVEHPNSVQVNEIEGKASTIIEVDVEPRTDAS